MISVDIGPPDPAMAEGFAALAQRAAPNVFMHPVALCASAEQGSPHIHVLRAFEGDALVGFWALREPRLLQVGPRFLSAPAYEYAFVANPVIEPDHADAVMAAFLAAIADNPRLPKVIKLRLLDDDAAAHAIMATVQSRGQMLTLSERTRPFLGSEADRKRSGSTAKKLRQDFNKLAAQGQADVTNARDGDDVRAAFEIFLDLEMNSWKGANGTALLSNDADAAFGRRFIANLSARRVASVALLRVDGKPIAAQVMLYSGARAYTWKTAFDAAFAKFSPGALLVDKATDLLFAEGVREIESCASEESFMAQLWTGRRTTFDLLIDVAPAKSASFMLLNAAERVRAWAKERRDALRALHWLTPKRKNLAITRG
jgi:CelD/BcsL family acetyltransferase involved in cellulose biosynthesis